jgi:hypothetical protein
MRVLPDPVGVTLKMLTPAQPESHIQRSIFILPGGFGFVNALSGETLEAPTGDEAQH